MILRIVVLVQLLLGGLISHAQIIEEMSVPEFEKYIDSLIANDNTAQAFDDYYAYTNFIPTYSKRKQFNTELLELQKRVEAARTLNTGTSREKLYYQMKSIIDKALDEGNYQKALLITEQFKDELDDASAKYNNIVHLLPTDTIEVYRQSFPYQLFTSPKAPMSYNSNLIPENTLLYLKKDSSLFTGVIISRQNDPMSMENGIARMDYDRFENGRRVERKNLGYVPSNSFHQNQLFIGHDSSHYRLNYKTIYHSNDTINTYYIGSEEELMYESVSLGQMNGAVKTIKEIEYNSDGSIDNWKELAPYTEKHTKYDSYSCWVNQLGDTVSEEFVLVTNELEIVQERKLNAQGDTISLSRTVNSFLDGLQIEHRPGDEGLIFKLRSVFDNGTVVDILSDSILYFNEDWKLISKEEYVRLMNQGADDFIYFGTGIFNEYFPEVDFKPYPYFIAVSYVDNKNYKQFKRAVNKYFKVKI